ncbi:MAG TPA: DUF4160 domain-containing protein [Candidatus Binatia bacterium]|jgi:hypothetical protein|nr:DUF4160 domain-containing protein [Candidatus Binatia bacterium]
MPVISTFFGIVIRMFYHEHGIPHFHAEHQGQQATFTFDGEILAGSIQSRTAPAPDQRLDPCTCPRVGSKLEQGESWRVFGKDRPVGLTSVK